MKSIVNIVNFNDCTISTPFFVFMFACLCMTMREN